MTDKLTQLISEANHVVAFTGAGISTESGIPDFRSSSGLYLSGEFEGHTPERILSKRFLASNKEIFFKFYKQRIMSMRDKQPNRCHSSMAELQSMGKLKSVINQNIDNLLQLAGVKNVWDLHGNITKFRCTSGCGKQYNQEMFMNMPEVPRCECGGYVRPCTVLFDEGLDDDVFMGAYRAAKQCDLLIVMGSSCSVQPAASLITEIGDTAKLVILNKTQTPYNHRADLIIHDLPCGEVLETVVKNLKGKV